MGDHGELAPLEALRTAYRGLTAVVTAVSDEDWARPTRCAGWSVGDLVFHVLADARRALVALATPATGPADRSFVTYWRDYPSGPRDERQTAATRAAARALGRPALRELWTTTAPAAVRAAAAAPPDGHVATQGHVLAVPDFLLTLATEAAVHHLDLGIGIPGPAALAAAVATVDGLAGGRRDTGRDEVSYLLKATGRLDLTAAERAAGLPVFG